MLKRELSDLLTYPLQVLQESAKSEIYPVGSVKMKSCEYHEWNRISDTEGWENINLAKPFGGEDKHWIFRTTVTVPEEASSKELWCSIGTGATDIWNYSNPQFLVYIDGKMICGLDVRHRDFPLPDFLKGRENFELALYSYASTTKPDIFLSIKLYACKESLQQFCIDLRLAWETAKQLEEDSDAFRTLSLACKKAMSLLDLRDLESESFADSLIHAHKVLSSLRGKFSSDIQVDVVGHSHIDMAWLWTLDQTREKAVRSYATVLNLMERYPEYKFSSSQPCLMEYLREDQPELFKGIMSKVSEGRWEIEGAMWIESDSILTSGESLVRQILWGKRWIKEYTGKDSSILWLPDCFGFSATLPQIMAGCGIDYFVTTKMGWNKTNRFPHDLFKWIGLDGSEVLAFMVTSKNYEPSSSYPKKLSNETTYNGLLTPSQIMGTWQRFQDKEKSSRVLHLYGYGDGGGGPTAGMLERQRRFADGFPGVPVTHQTTVHDFLKKLEEEADTPARWFGEMYLEYHRGTYTTMSESKRLNRVCENTAVEAEIFSSLAWLLGGDEYPYDQFESTWKDLLLNQFHDILPGSAIDAVYQESHRQLNDVLCRFKKIKAHAAEVLLSNISASKNELIVFNPLCEKRSEIVTHKVQDGYVLQSPDGDFPTSWRDGDLLHFMASDLPSCGWKRFCIVPGSCDSASIPFRYENGFLTTPFYEIEIDSDLSLTRLYDRNEDRELVKKGQKGNLLKLYADYPENYDAWNIGGQGKTQNWNVQGEGDIEVLSINPLFITLELKRRYLNSAYSQTIKCYAHDRRIDFSLDVDWHEDHLMLRTLFETDIFSPRASYNIAYGVCERTTHNNTSWDEAAFEVPAHSWADLSELGYGAALLSSQSYGYSVKEGVLSLSLLRSPTYPNSKADRGGHSFFYSFLPHNGSYQDGMVVSAGRALHHKPFVLQGVGNDGNLPAEFESFTLSDENVICETVKKSEDRKSILFRLVEMDGKRTKLIFKSFLNIKEAWECNLLEERVAELDSDDISVSLDFKARQIKTLELVFG